jgi:hypothetical protein
VRNLPERQIPLEFSSCNIPPPDSISAVEFIQELKRVPESERMAVVRTWMQDRSPAAFSTLPYLWEAARDWFAKRCEVSPRQIGLAGSAQLGFSTSPMKAFAPFDKTLSDLDFYLVSDELFSKLQKEASIFITRQFSAINSDFYEQAKTTERTLKRGYIDLQQIPAIHERYPKVARMRNDTSILMDKLKLSGFTLKASHFRVYRDWDAKARWTSIQAKSWIDLLQSE